MTTYYARSFKELRVYQKATEVSQDVFRLSFEMSAVATPHRIRFGKLHGSADAFALARLAATHAPLVVVCGTALEAQRLREEIPWFAPHLRVSLFPDWETLPYDTFSPHQDVLSGSSW